MKTQKKIKRKIKRKKEKKKRKQKLAAMLSVVAALPCLVAEPAMAASAMDVVPKPPIISAFLRLYNH